MTLRILRPPPLLLLLLLALAPLFKLNLKMSGHLCPDLMLAAGNYSAAHQRQKNLILMCQAAGMSRIQNMKVTQKTDVKYTPPASSVSTRHGFAARGCKERTLVCLLSRPTRNARFSCNDGPPFRKYRSIVIGLRILVESFWNCQLNHASLWQAAG